MHMRAVELGINPLEAHCCRRVVVMRRQAQGLKFEAAKVPSALVVIADQ
jgi:hypothetical protein